MAGARQFVCLLPFDLKGMKSSSVTTKVPGGVLLFQRPTDWEDFKALQRTLTEEEKAEAAMLFARSQEDNQPFDRDPFAGWQE